MLGYARKKTAEAVLGGDKNVRIASDDFIERRLKVQSGCTLRNSFKIHVDVVALPSLKVRTASGQSLFGKTDLIGHTAWC
jgi:hypothetical protein